jgi:hypothetical protein
MYAYLATQRMWPGREEPQHTHTHTHTTHTRTHTHARTHTNAIYIANNASSAASTFPRFSASTLRATAASKPISTRVRICAQEPSEQQARIIHSTWAPRHAPSHPQTSSPAASRRSLSRMLLSSATLHNRTAPRCRCIRHSRAHKQPHRRTYTFARSLAHIHAHTTRHTLLHTTARA